MYHPRRNCLLIAPFSLLPSMFARCLQTGRRSLSTQSAVTPAKQIIFSGIQPTGVPHLGNYLGALKNWVRLQETVYKEAKIFFSIVDLLDITVPVSPKDLRRDRDEMWYSLYAAGIDMERCIVFEQSAVLSPLLLAAGLIGRFLNMWNCIGF